MNQENLKLISLDSPEEQEALFDSLFIEARAIEDWKDICPIYQKVRPVLIILKSLPKIGKYIELLIIAMDTLCANASN
jgi:hypothetical protein